MIEALEKIGIWAIAGIAAYVVYRWVSRPRDSALTNYEREMQEVLTSDVYRVKGKFEE